MSKDYGNLIINIFWRVLTLCLLATLFYFVFDSISREHYKVVPDSIEYKVTTKGKHFKNFTVENSEGKTYRLEGKVDKNGRITYFVNGQKMKMQSKMSKYIKDDKLKYNSSMEESHNRYSFIQDNYVFCYHENGFYLFVRLAILVLNTMFFIGLIFGIIRNIEFYNSCNSYDWKVIRRYENGDYFTPFGLYIDYIVCSYDLKEYIKEFFGYDNK